MLHNGPSSAAVLSMSRNGSIVLCKTLIVDCKDFWMDCNVYDRYQKCCTANENIVHLSLQQVFAASHQTICSFSHIMMGGVDVIQHPNHVIKISHKTFACRFSSNQIIEGIFNDGVEFLHAAVSIRIGSRIWGLLWNLRAWFIRFSQYLCGRFNCTDTLLLLRVQDAQIPDRVGTTWHVWLLHECVKAARGWMQLDWSTTVIILMTEDGFVSFSILLIIYTAIK